MIKGKMCFSDYLISHQTHTTRFTADQLLLTILKNVVRKVMQKLPLWFCLYLPGHIVVPHFLTQTSFYCCQQQSPNIAAEEKNCIAFASCKHHQHSYRRNVIPEKL